MNKLVRRPILLLLVFVILPVASPAQQGGAARRPTSSSRRPAVGVFRDLEGRAVRLNLYRGKVVLVNFWATWCPPCRVEIPDLIRLQERHAGELQVIGITHPPERRAAVRRLARQLKINYPLILGTRRTASLFGVGEILPATIIIDRDGRVRDTILGILEPEEFDEKIRPLLESTRRAAVAGGLLPAQGQARHARRRIRAALR